MDTRHPHDTHAHTSFSLSPFLAPFHSVSLSPLNKLPPDNTATTMSEPESVQDYGSTLSFSILCSTFDVSETAPDTQTKTRIFDKTSANLSQYGCWHCVLTETKRNNMACIELNLSLTWQSYQDPASSPSSPASFNQQETAKGQQGVASNARELINRIQSIKMRSDSTLSELLVDRLDGHRIFEGDTIQGTLCFIFVSFHCYQAHAHV